MGLGRPFTRTQSVGRTDTHARKRVQTRPTTTRARDARCVRALTSSSVAFERVARFLLVLCVHFPARARAGVRGARRAIGANDDDDDDGGVSSSHRRGAGGASNADGATRSRRDGERAGDGERGDARGGVAWGVCVV